MSTGGGIAQGRLAEERKAWRKNHPHGFVARPVTKPDGSVDLLTWQCIIPGKSNTDWEDGYYPLTVHFSRDYPLRAPNCNFPPNFFHPNVYQSGAVCLSILGHHWRPSITVKQLLVGIQDLLDKPNPSSAAQPDCNRLFTHNLQEYKNRVRQQAKLYPSQL